MKSHWGKYGFSSTLSLTSASDGVDGLRQATAIITRETESLPIIQEAGRAPGPVWTGEIL